MSTTLAALRRRANKARDFPANTCPASRHLQDMADSLARYGDYPMFEEDPRHCAESIYAVIAALWGLAPPEPQQGDLMPAAPQ